ncbi:tetratricopeptide repeat protein [Carboxylicivirga sp. M1479]|uniref:tetratricopeptide repeat-containing sensor histidine kinase n=1 Tax=Carboxylicivirga sp. M1479 TaxID=2594476 RepID=UPI0011778FC3|nr:tetratricopeptide repeat protein [Carboxylicivirga sp. M1479]TRX62366.1 tetratricopeptide repeat protein [Carboxylicivirga sp. M1479]
MSFGRIEQSKKYAIFGYILQIDMSYSRFKFLLLIIGFTILNNINVKADERDDWLEQMAHFNIVVSSNPDSIFQLALECIDTCPLTEMEKQAYSNSFFAEYYYYKQDLAQSMASYRIALKSFLAVKDSTKLASIYNNIGLLHYLKADFDSALVAYDHSLKLELRADNKEGIAQSYQNLGIIYGKWERYELVHEYYNNALRLYEELGNQSAIADVNNNLAVIAVRMGKSNLAFDYYKQAYSAFNALGEEGKMASVAANLGRLFFQDKQMARSFEYFTKSLKIFHDLDDKVGLVHTYSMMGEMYLANEDMDKALMAYDKANLYNQSIGLREVQLGNLGELYKAYKNLGEFEQANNILESRVALEDSIYDSQQYEKLLDLEKKYNAEKSQKELVVLQAKEERNRLYMWGLSALFLLMTIIAMIWVYVLKIKDKQRQLIMEQKVLRTQMNPHFIFNTLSALQCIILENNKEDAVDFVADFSGLMRLILEYAKEEQITLEAEKEILDKYMSIQNRRFDNSINYSIEFDENIELNSVLVPPMLTQPFIENAIEHGQLTKPDSYIHVHLAKREECLEFSIEDNGIGIHNSLEQRKEDGSTHKSMAVQLTRDRLKLLNSKEQNIPVTLKIEDMSKYGKQGTRVVFNVPFETLN